MSRNYVKKKFNYVQIHSVSSAYKESLERLKPIQHPYSIDGVPEGYFCPVFDGVLLPRRRRGEKFIVYYAAIHRDVF